MAVSELGSERRAKVVWLEQARDRSSGLCMEVKGGIKRDVDSHHIVFAEGDAQRCRLAIVGWNQLFSIARIYIGITWLKFGLESWNMDLELGKD